MQVNLEYSVEFGYGDGSDTYGWNVEIYGEQEAAYLRAKKLRLELDEVESLYPIISTAYEEIEKVELDNALGMGDEYAIECLGKGKVDPDYINDLVEERDEHTMKFFGLSNMSEKELKAWNASDLSELPAICDFEEDFESRNPFEEGWSLYVHFAEHPEEEELSEEEARNTLSELFGETNGDYSVICDYINRCDDLFVGDDLQRMAKDIADSMGIVDFE